MCYFIVCLQWIMYWVLFGWLLGDFMGDRQGLSFSVKWLYFFVVYILVALVPSKKWGAGGVWGVKICTEIFWKIFFKMIIERKSNQNWNWQMKLKLFVKIAFTDRRKAPESLGITWIEGCCTDQKIKWHKRFSFMSFEKKWVIAMVSSVSK